MPKVRLVVQHKNRRMAKEVELPTTPVQGDHIKIAPAHVMSYRTVDRRYLDPGGNLVEVHFEEIEDGVFEWLATNDPEWETL